MNGRLAGRAGGSGATYIFVRYRFQIPEEEELLDINDRSGGICSITRLSDGIKITAEKACTVAISDDGGRHYTRIPAVAVDGELNALETVIFDVDGDGEISTSDSNLINRSLVSPSLKPYRELGWS